MRDPVRPVLFSDAATGWLLLDVLSADTTAMVILPFLKRIENHPMSLTEKGMVRSQPLTATVTLRFMCASNLRALHGPGTILYLSLACRHPRQSELSTSWTIR